MKKFIKEKDLIMSDIKEAIEKGNKRLKEDLRKELKEDFNKNCISGINTRLSRLEKGQKETKTILKAIHNKIFKAQK